MVDEHIDNNDMVSLAVFDFDGTVLDGQSPAIMVFNLAKQRKMPVGRALKVGAWGLMYKAGVAKNSVKVRRRIFKTFRDESSEDTDDLISRIYENKIAPRIRERALERIAWHKERGDLVVFVSASFEIMTEQLVEDTEAFGQSSTRMVIEDGAYTGEIDGVPVEGPEKVKRLTTFADEHFGAGKWKVVYSYADHDSDEGILALAEHPVAVNPNRRLEAIANENGWEIQEW